MYGKTLLLLFNTYNRLDHKKSDSITNVVLQLDAVPVSIADAITGTRTAS